MGRTTELKIESRPHNMRLAIAGGQWFIAVLYFYYKFVLADSLVPLNARHRQAQERYGQA
jgi:hypothetical protein